MALVIGFEHYNSLLFEGYVQQIRIFSAEEFLLGRDDDIVLFVPEMANNGISCILIDQEFYGIILADKDRIDFFFLNKFFCIQESSTNIGLFESRIFLYNFLLLPSLRNQFYDQFYRDSWRGQARHLGICCGSARFCIWG